MSSPSFDADTAAAAVMAAMLPLADAEPADLALVEAWIREAHGWAYVDPLAGDIAGPIALCHPVAWPLIDAWAADARDGEEGSGLRQRLDA